MQSTGPGINRENKTSSEMWILASECLLLGGQGKIMTVLGRTGCVLRGGGYIRSSEGRGREKKGPPILTAMLFYETLCFLFP